MEHFGNHVYIWVMMEECQNLRERTGLTRKEIAAIIGCSSNSVQRWEDGMDPQPYFRRKIKKLVAEKDLQYAQNQA